MIDHAGARRLAASAVDRPLDEDDRVELDAHLRACSACRRVADALGRDARSMAALDLGTVPIAVRAGVAIAADRGGRREHVARWIGLVAVGALLVVALGGGVFGGGGARMPDQPASSNSVKWETRVADVTAADFRIEVGGVAFLAADPKIQVVSDIGDAAYRTFELTWHEAGVEQRLFLYFTNDARTWWVRELRIYDGQQPGAWITTVGRYFEAPLGSAWQGSLDLTIRDAKRGDGAVGILHLRDATVAMRIAGPVNVPDGGANGPDMGVPPSPTTGPTPNASLSTGP